MRILFIHAADGRLKPEYKVHTALATATAEQHIESFFIWQSSASPLKPEPRSVTYCDFGRDIGGTLHHSRYRRAILVLKHLPSALRTSIERARQLRPDIIYSSQQAMDVPIARIISRLLKIPHVIHIHYNVGPWLGRYVLSVIRKTPHLIAVSEFIRQGALLQGVSPSNIHTVPNAILPSLHAPFDRGHLLASLGLQEDRPLVVAAGRLDPGKGHLLLFEAFARVTKRSPHARLLVCGESSTRNGYDGHLRQRVAELGISSSVVFAGHRDDLPAILQLAHVFCLPAELEPFGLVYLEAMAAGLPVVACYSGAVPEIVIHETTGLLSYPDDPDALAENLMKVIDDKALAIRMGRAGQVRANTEFTLSRVAIHWAKQLRQIGTGYPRA